jgi:hypothetical protein
VSGDVSTSTLNSEFDFQLALFIKGRNVKVSVVNLYTRWWNDVRRGNDARSLLTQVHHYWLVVLRGEDKVLDVQDDLGDVFLDTRNGGELVEIRIEVTAAPGIEDSRVRRSELPSV